MTNELTNDLLPLMAESSWRGVRKISNASVFGMLALLVLAPPAFSSSHHPTGEFEDFAECPLNRQAVTNCAFAVSSSGRFKIGKKEVSVRNPITLQGAYIAGGLGFVGAEDGETLSKTPQPVPGGLQGVDAPAWWPGWLQAAFNELIGEGLTGVTATAELAAPARSILLQTGALQFEERTALALPVKIKLESPILGSNCYIGSNSKPIRLHFTSGTSGSFSGAGGGIVYNGNASLFVISGAKIVDGTFKAPSASGCGGIFSYFIDPLVNSIVGLPSGPGENVAILEGKYLDGAVSEVKASE